MKGESESLSANIINLIDNYQDKLELEKSI